MQIDEFNSITRKAMLSFEMEKDKSLVPFQKIIFCFISYLVLLLITLLKGSEHYTSIAGIKSCSPLYWGVYLSYIPISIVITIITGRIVCDEYNYRLTIGYPYHSSDVKWNRDILVKYPLYALFTGLLSGLLGIGGGLILGPLLLELGIHPLVSTATSNFLVVFISSSTSLQYSIMGMMNFNYGSVCIVLSTIGSYIGTLLIQKYLERTKRNSILVFTLAAVLGISTIFIPGHTVIQMKNQMQNGIDIWDFKSPC
jgi:uncharacterized membrane protein YfcA